MAGKGPGIICVPPPCIRKKLNWKQSSWTTTDSFHMNVPNPNAGLKQCNKTLTPFQIILTCLLLPALLLLLRWLEKKMHMSEMLLPDAVLCACKLYLQETQSSFLLPCLRVICSIRTISMGFSLTSWPALSSNIYFYSAGIPDFPYPRWLCSLHISPAFVSNILGTLFDFFN